MPLGMMRQGFTYQPTGAPPPGGGFDPGWNDFSSSTFATGAYSMWNGSITLHGVVNTNQLVGTTVYTEVDAGVLKYYVRGFVLDTSTGAINLGERFSPYNSPVTSGTWYGAIDANSDTGQGVMLGVTDASFFVRARGYNITNYTSCNQTTAPTITFGASQDIFTNGNTSGQALAVKYVNNNRYVVTTRGNDANRRRSLIWNGSTMTLEGTLVTLGSSGAGFDLVVFENPGSSLTYGAHHITHDPNGNYVNAGHFSSNTTQQIRSDFYSGAKSSVRVRGVAINDVAGANRSLIVARNGESFLTARVLTTTDFSSTSSSTWGTAATFAGINNGQINVSKGIQPNEYFAWYTVTNGIHYIPLTVSGTTVTWGTDQGFVGAALGVFTITDTHHYTDGTNDWFISATGNSAGQGQIKAMVNA